MSPTNLMSPVSGTTYDTLIIDTLPAFLDASIRKDWDRFLAEAGVHNLTMTHGWLSAYLRRFPPERPCVIIVRDGEGHWMGVAPLQIARGRTGYSQRLLRYVQFIGTQPTVFDWMDIAIHPKADSHAVLTAMSNALRQCRWDALDLYFCPNRSRLELFSRLLNGQSIGSDQCVDIRESMPMPWLSLPDTEADYLASRPKRTRANITRCRNLLHRETGQEAALIFHRCDPTPERGQETRKLLRRFVDGHIESWRKRGVKSDFARYPDLEGFYAEVLEQADTSEGQAPVLLFSTLEKDGQPMSFHLGFQQHDWYLLHLTYYDRAFERYSPGMLHIEAMIVELVRQGRRLFNFGRGDEPYKRSWTKITQPLWSLRLFRTPWHRLVWEVDATLKRLSGRMVL